MDVISHESETDDCAKDQTTVAINLKRLRLRLRQAEAKVT
jgi:hypothetical protein